MPITIYFPPTSLITSHLGTPRLQSSSVCLVYANPPLWTACCFLKFTSSLSLQSRILHTSPWCTPCPSINQQQTNIINYYTSWGFFPARTTVWRTSPEEVNLNLRILLILPRPLIKLLCWCGIVKQTLINLPTERSGLLKGRIHTQFINPHIYYYYVTWSNAERRDGIDFIEIQPCN